MKARNIWNRKRDPNLPNPKKLNGFLRKFLNREGVSI
jgi:predicted Rdx family selenoprotein